MRHSNPPLFMASQDEVLPGDPIIFISRSAHCCRSQAQIFFGWPSSTPAFCPSVDRPRPSLATLRALLLRSMARCNTECTCQTARYTNQKRVKRWKTSRDDANRWLDGRPYEDIALFPADVWRGHQSDDGDDTIKRGEAHTTMIRDNTVSLLRSAYKLPSRKIKQIATFSILFICNLTTLDMGIQSIHTSPKRLKIPAPR